MEIELNTTNLRKLCRICLGAGEYNLWEHNVCWSNIAMGRDEMEASSQDTKFITVHEVLQMYNDWQHTILEMDEEIQLICKDCLNELQPHYRYYRRLVDANKQMKQLYEEALQQEGNKPELMAEQMIIEDAGFENNLSEFFDIAPKEPQPDQSANIIIYSDKLDLAASHTQTTATKQAQKRKFVRNPTFILTGGVTQLLAHATGATSFGTTQEISAQLPETSSLCSPAKRKRKEVDMELPEQEKEASSDLIREHTVNAVNLRMAGGNTCSNSQEVEDGAVVTSVEKIVQGIPPNEILKFGFDPDEEFHELVTTNQEKETPLESENEEQAALPFSTLRADDAGRSIYVCKYCPQAFTAPSFLLTHARKSHACKYCSKAFVKTVDLFAHVKEAHQEHKCDICGKELSTSGNLRAHIRRIHRLKMPKTMPAQLFAKNRTNQQMSIINEESGDGGGESAYIEETSQSMTAEYLD
ncbi:zinc finger protein 236 [Anastrepha ludens]|uniref:zinc finger protein 236 n=1 Tax=Anastrepha ludens TaxID=28586 RepID=UPI0023B1B950|nr:zinc finger protein 236 [Anastrepha ludens]